MENEKTSLNIRRIKRQAKRNNTNSISSNNNSTINTALNC